MSGFMNNAIVSVDDINSTDIGSMLVPVLKEMEGYEIPLNISNSCERFFALLWRIVVTTIHKNLSDVEATTTLEGRKATLQASFPDELSKYATDYVEERMCAGTPTFTKRLIEILIGCEVTEMQYLFMGATLDYFIYEIVACIQSEYDSTLMYDKEKERCIFVKNDVITLRELYESMSRHAPTLSSWTGGKGFLYSWMVWKFIEYDGDLKEYFGNAGLGGPLTHAADDDDEEDDDEDKRVSKAVVAMQASDIQYIDHMKQMLAVFPFQGLLEKRDEYYFKCFIKGFNDWSVVRFNSIYEEVMPNVFHLCKGNNFLLGMFDSRLAAALDISGLDDDSIDTALSFVSDLSELPTVNRIISRDMDQDDDEGRRGANGNGEAVLAPNHGSGVLQYTAQFGLRVVDIRNALDELFR